MILEHSNISVSDRTDMLTTLKNEATKVALELKPDFITGHSLGGITVELVW
jgi:hypothetical protein